MTFLNERSEYALSKRKSVSRLDNVDKSVCVCVDIAIDMLRVMWELFQLDAVYFFKTYPM